MKLNIKMTLVIVFSSVLVVGIGIGVYKKNINDKKSVEVMPVSYVSSMGMGSETFTNGIVNNKQVQEIFLENQQTVKEVFIKDGDQVNVGDKLFSYDTRMLELDMEAEKIQIQQAEAKIKSLKSELQILKNTNPIKKSVGALNKTVLGKDSDLKYKTSSLYESAENILLLKSKGNKIYNVNSVKESDGEAILYKSIDIDSKPYTGDGTADNPYRFLCTDDVVIVGGFMNQLMGYDVSGSNKENDSLVAVFEVHRGDVVHGTLLYMWTFDGANNKPVSIDSKWNFGFTSNEKNPPEEKPEEPEKPAQEDGYTKEELTKLIYEKEEELRNQELSKRESELKCEKITKSLNQSTVLSKVQGVVKIQGREEETATQTPYIVVNGGEGFYITGNISELLLEELKIGDIVTAQVSSENGQMMQYEAVVSEISEYPVSNTEYYSGGNSNVSYYPFTAVIKETEGLTNGQYVDLSIKDSTEEGAENSFYIQKAYIREENGKSYVYVADENNRLVKRYVKTGKIINGGEIEILEGMIQEDRIAFPYGKNVKEGIKVKDQDENNINNF